MNIDFTKMHGLGNDFVVIDAIRQPLSLTGDQVRHIANRRFGVGCDQLLLVESPQSSEAAFRYRIFNADGGEVSQCGNGARCFARFVADKGLTDLQTIPVETRSGVITLYLEADNRVRVDMGLPCFDPSALPFSHTPQADHYEIEVAGERLRIGVVSMGNPHLVLEVEDIDTAPVAHLGPLLEAHPLFPQRVNVGFMQRIDNGHIRLRVYERGAGETLACGTGACAAVAVGQCWGILGEQVTVDLPGGQLEIAWQGPGTHLWMTGPAENVFEGSIEL